MLSVITGKQRAGKTYYCVTLIIEYLQNSNRPIYTNLPLNSDILCDYAANGKNRHPAVYENYLQRLFLFKSFRGRKGRNEYRYFRKRNPDYVAMHKLHKKNKKPGLITDQENIKIFWKIIQLNSVIFLDELYQWFSSDGVFERDDKMKLLRKELLTYTRQHGHSKDDMFLVSHSQNDLDVHIRRGIQRLYIVENSKYKNISNKFLLRGIKWPIQFFLVSAYEHGETEHSDRYVRFSKSVIFRCYESFSSAETLDKGRVSEEAKSTDTHIDNKQNIRNYLSQSYIFIIVIIFFIVFGIFGYRYVLNNLLVSNTKIDESKTQSLAKNNEQSDATESAEIKKDKKESVNGYYKVLFVSPNTIVFEDNSKLNKGDSINGYTVKKFARDYAVLSDGQSDIRCEYSGLKPKLSAEPNSKLSK